MPIDPPTALASLGERYPDTLVGLERFAPLLGQSSAALRARRSGSVEFPSPVGSEPRARFLLGELVEWAIDAGLTDRVVERRVTRFALECAVRACALAHRSRATNRFVGGVALCVAAGWRPETDDPGGLVRRLRVDDVPRWTAPLAPELVERGFEPDTHPAHDPRVRAATISWRGPDDDPSAAPVIPDDSPEAAAVVREMLALHGSDADPGRFARIVDLHVLPLLRAPGRPTSTTPRLLAATMAALAPVATGSLVCDPALGEGSTVIDLVERTRESALQTIGITARELDEVAWTIAKIRLGVRSIAHRLGEPGSDSLEPGALDERFDVVVCEPAARRRNYREWFRLCHALVHEGGTAIIAVPAEILGHDFPLGSWWDTEVEHVRSIVLTPRDRRRTKGEAWAVCALRSRPTDRIDVVLATESNDPDWVREESRRLSRASASRWIANRHALLPMNPAQIAAIASMERRGTVPTGRAIGLDVIRVEARPAAVADLVDDALGPWPKRRRPGRLDESPDAVMAMMAPIAPSSMPDETIAFATHPLHTRDDAPSAQDEVAARALRDVLRLRWLLDPDREVDVLLDPEPDPDPRIEEQRRKVRAVLGVDDVRAAIELDDADRGAIAGEATDEVRRALKRLGQRLSGTETRGRRS